MPEPPPPPRTGGIKGSGLILVVDDDPQMRQLIQAALEDEGLPVATAADGRQALRRAAQARPALVVLDISIPRVASPEVATRLRAVYGQGLPILVITADGHAADKARQVGAYAYLKKPFELDALIAAVEQGLGGA
jgi:two-component system OmpR family response regulator